MLPQLSEIRVRRRKLGLTQAQLAKEAGVSQSLIAKIESESIDASYSNTKKIFEAMDALERKESLTASDVMNRHVLCVSKTDAVSKAITLMREKGLSQLPVFEGSHPVGSVSEKTVLDKLTSGTDQKTLSSLPVREIMAESFPVIDEKTPLSAVSSLLSYQPAVLVRKKERIAGIITKSDLLGAVAR